MKAIIITIQIALLMLASCSDEISQWRGPSRDGIYPGKDLVKAWPDGGPQLKLKIDSIGKGYSQPVVYKNKIYLSGIKYDTMDVITSYDMEGNLLWEKEYGVAWKGTYPDSKATPTIEKNRIYLIGGKGDLVCLNAKNGDIIWNHNPMIDFEGKHKHWGIVESALVTDDAVLYVTGGEKTTLVAFDKKTGELMWESESTGGSKSYASSSLVEWNGIQMALVQTSDDVIGFDVKDGSVLWRHNTIQYHEKKGAGEAANTPLFHNGEVFVTYGNDQPGLMLSIAEDGKSVDLKWRNDILDTHHGGLVLVDGIIYASNMEHNTKGGWAAVDWKTGETLWEREWHTKGSIISADGMLYLYEERTGHVALAKPDKNDLDIVSSFRITEGRGAHWSHPAIYNGMLFIRHGEVLMIYDISNKNNHG
jgi:outer membrane protein assembly factor BamB